MWTLSEIFHWAPLLPVLVFSMRRVRSSRSWWLTAAFLVSFVADTLAHWIRPGWVVAAVYPVAQYGLVFAALAPRRLFFPFLGLVTICAMLAAGAETYAGPSAALRIVGALLVLSLVLPNSDLRLMRTALVIYYGLGAIFWLGIPFLLERPTALVAAWLGYQGCRLIGLALFTIAGCDDRRAAQVVSHQP